MESVKKEQHEKLVAKVRASKPDASGKVAKGAFAPIVVPAGKEGEPEPKVKIILRCNPKHPTGKYRVLDLVISRVFAEYEITAKHAKVLMSVEGRAWVEVGNEAKLKADLKLRGMLGDLKELDKQEI